MSQQNSHTHNSFSLVVLAAGMGSRFWGPKQLELLGPRRQTILQYSIQDAYEAGCRHVVMVTRSELLPDIEEIILSELPPDMKVDVALQETDILPEGHSHLAGARVKPWGNGHAVWCAREYLHQPFVVMFSDDWYGPWVFEDIQALLTHNTSALIGYQLGNTLSDSWAVNRWVCEVDENGMLTIVDETLGIEKKGEVYTSEKWIRALTDSTPVSMWLMLLMPNFVQTMNAYVDDFFQQQEAGSVAECYLTEIMNRYMDSGNHIRLHATHEPWAWVTYREDIPQLNRVLGEHYER